MNRHIAVMGGIVLTLAILAYVVLLHSLPPANLAPQIFPDTGEPIAPEGKFPGRLTSLVTWFVFVTVFPIIVRLLATRHR